jgi:hypothetical protein
MNKRVSITLPERAVALLNRKAPRGQRSAFIAAAVEQYVKRQGSPSLRRRLKAGYQAGWAEDLRIAREWST